VVQFFKKLQAQDLILIVGIRFTRVRELNSMKGGLLSMVFLLPASPGGMNRSHDLEVADGKGLNKGLFSEVLRLTWESRPFCGWRLVGQGLHSLYPP